LKSIERFWPWLMAGMRQYGKYGPAGCNPAVLDASEPPLGEASTWRSPRPGPRRQHNGAAFLA
jgi:hypothetical protein